MKRALPFLAFASLLFSSAASAQVDATPAPEESPRPAPPPIVIEANPTPAPAPVDDKQKKWPMIVGARFDGGYAVRNLFDIPIRGADIGGAVGGQPLEHGAFWGTMRVMIGSTESGLSFWDVHVGGEAEAVVYDRFRFGGGLGLFLLGVARATKDETIRTWGPEVRGFARFDALQSEGFAIFVRAAIQAGYEFYDSATIWGPTVGAGIDFDLKGKRPSE